MSGLHGTEAGYQKHHRNRIPACRPCLDAHRAYNREILNRPTPAVPHGTFAGLRVHMRDRSPVCTPCLDWACAYEDDQRRTYMTRFNRRTAGLPMKDAAA